MTRDVRRADQLFVVIDGRAVELVYGLRNVRGQRVIKRAGQRADFARVAGGVISVSYTQLMQCGKAYFYFII